MSVIRSGSASSRPVFVAIRDAEEEARQILSSAKERAAIDANAARLQAFEQGKRQGYEEGRRQGQAAALEEARQSLSSAAAALSHAVEQYEEARERFNQDMRGDCAGLALAVARKIIKRQVRIDPDVLAANLEAAVKLITSAKNLRIAFHPDDRAALDAALARLGIGFPAVAGAALVEDAALAPGGCRIHTETGLVDADLNGQLDRLIAQLLPGDGESA